MKQISPFKNIICIFGVCCGQICFLLYSEARRKRPEEGLLGKVAFFGKLAIWAFISSLSKVVNKDMCVDV
jgi:hypothetical protein